MFGTGRSDREVRYRLMINREEDEVGRSPRSSGRGPFLPSLCNTEFELDLSFAFGFIIALSVIVGVEVGIGVVEVQEVPPHIVQTQGDRGEDRV
jgi:hypothetical protein